MEENKEILEQETEVIKALKEEYEAKLAEQKASFDNTLATMRKEHTEQLRAILRTGEAPKEVEAPEVEEVKDEITAAVERIRAKYKKSK